MISISKVWYNTCKNKVLLLKKANENSQNVLSVTGSDNNWEITDSQENVLGNAGCKPDNNKWIIVEVTTWDSTNKKAGDSFIFYVDDIAHVTEKEVCYGVFEEIKCYSIEIIAANTSAVQNMWGVFYYVKSALEQDGKGDTGPGLIGLDKLNVENVTNISMMFYKAIHKQATLSQLGKWRFSGAESVMVTNLFLSTVKWLNFTVLNGWSKSTNNETVYFWRGYFDIETIFVDGKKYNFTPPNWYKDIKKDK